MAAQENEVDVGVGTSHRDQGDSTTDGSDKQSQASNNENNISKATNFHFEQWTKTIGLSRKTEKILRSEELVGEKVLSLLCQQDLNMLDLTMGQKKLLWAGILELQRQFGINTGSLDTNRPELGTLPANKDSQPRGPGEVTSREPGRPQTVVGVGSQPEQSTGVTLDSVSNLLANLLDVNQPTTDSGKQTTSRPEDANTSETSGENSNCANKDIHMGDQFNLSKYLNSLKDWELRNKDEVVSVLPSGGQLVYKSEKSRVKLDKLNPAQWCAANCKILQELILNTRDFNVVGQYLEYVKRMCELAECYEWPSILQYDQAFRAHQQTTKCRWDDHCPHIDRLYLRVLPKSVTNNESRFRGGRGKMSMQEPCRLYNMGKCYYQQCKFIHVCSVPGCQKPHPQVSHFSANRDSKNGVS